MDRKKRTAIIPVIISREDNWYVAKDIDSGVASQGKTVEEAMDNLKEALELYYEDRETEITEDQQVMLTTMEVSL